MADSRFLLVRLGSLGDIVHAFPAVSAMRTAFPAAEIVWITHPTWEALARSADLVTDVWTVDPRDWDSMRGILKRIRAHRFDTAIDYQGLWKSAGIPFLAGVPKRVGFSSRTVREAGVPVLYTDRVTAAPGHIANQNGELSVRAGARAATGPVQIRVSGEDEKVVEARLLAEGITEYVVLSPGGGWRSKCWPVERYGELANRIFEKFGTRCVINAGPGEEDLGPAVVRAAGNAQSVSFTSSFGQLTALLKHASLIVAGDTGPLHLADALGTRLVAIYGPTDPARNGPYWRSGVALRWSGATTSHRRGREADESLLHISVDEVMQAVQGLRAAA